MEVVYVDDYTTYENNYKSFMKTLAATGAAIFKGLDEHNNIFAQSVVITSTAAYHVLAKESAID